jgi:hypothetical protein
VGEGEDSAASRLSFTSPLAQPDDEQPPEQDDNEDMPMWARTSSGLGRWSASGGDWTRFARLKVSSSVGVVPG